MEQGREIGKYSVSPGSLFAGYHGDVRSSVSANEV